MKRPAPLEAKLEGLFRYLVRSQLGGIVVKIAPTMSGVPDRLVLLPMGRVYLVELKKVGGTVSEIQRHTHARLLEVGTRVVVLTGEREIRGWCLERARDYDPPATRAVPLAKRKTAACETCGTPNVALRVDGTYRIHGPVDDRCAASGELPPNS